jgi:phenylacetate-CoA ligase
MHLWSRSARRKARILRERYLNAYNMTESSMKAFAEMLVRWRPAMFRAYGSAMALFAALVKEQGIDGIRPKFIELTAEKVTGPQRQLLEEVFQCPVADWYSSREMGTIAFQCPHGGRHVCETRYLELVANGRVVPPGEMGEVVITSLHQYTMPFIRYRQDDIAVYDPSPCACGRGLPVLREMVGRSNDFVVTADGQYVHPTYFADLRWCRPEVARFQVYQPDAQHLTLRLLPRREIDPAWLEEVRQELHGQLGTSMQVEVELVDDIPLTPEGKHRFIVSAISSPFADAARPVPRRTNDDRNGER